MSETKILRLSAGSADKLGRLRLRGDIQVAGEGEYLWLKISNKADLEYSLGVIPWAERFHRTGNDLLVPVGCRVPIMRLPTLAWQSLSTWLRPALPSAGLAGRSTETVGVTLVPSASVGEANVLETDAASWHAYASRAPNVRLARWSFAMAADDRVIVRGEPIPSLPGSRFCAQAGVAVEAGYRIEPAVDPHVLATAWQLTEGDMVLLCSHAADERIAADDFVAATRSAVRISYGGVST